jgi:hypothetical protein
MISPVETRPQFGLEDFDHSIFVIGVVVNGDRDLELARVAEPIRILARISPDIGIPRQLRRQFTERVTNSASGFGCKSTKAGI